MVLDRLDGGSWPSAERWPVNRASAQAGDHIRRDLLGSTSPLIVAGYASIGQLIDLLAEWSEEQRSGVARVLLGAEPFGTTRASFAAPSAAFTDEVVGYWRARGVSVLLSAKVLQVIGLVRAGRVEVRFVHGQQPLHAKVYVGDEAATTGSSNFTAAGLSGQVEVNARFGRSDDPVRYTELAQIAERLWAAGEDWSESFVALLELLLRQLPWVEVLARAAAEVLEGEWASSLLAGTGVGLWPSQRAGIAQALWVAERVGSVLVADATGSGKTRMGAHLVRAMRDRLWLTGRSRSGLVALVCPPAVEEVWQREAVLCGLNVATVSHGLLSRGAGEVERVEAEAVRAAQILAIDEAHNFLNRGSARSREVRRSLADQVVLFTATPINRSASDLLSLVDLLGADNFSAATLDALRSLERRRGDAYLDPASTERLRGEIQQFTVRRTKSALNALVDREPDGYRHPVTGRVCRYPLHDTRTYATGETDDDAAVATEIRDVASSLQGLALLDARLAVPAGLRDLYSDERWWELRHSATKGLSAHQVLAALRSSNAALVEHVLGTNAAALAWGLAQGFKRNDTGDRVGRLGERAGAPPEVLLDCPLPDWVTDPDRWAGACRDEADRYRRIADLAGRLSTAREDAKVALLRRLASSHARVLAFDAHLITLAVLERRLVDDDVEVIVAIGADQIAKKRVRRLLAPDADGKVIALCSDALNEGVNLQGASVIVHLDLPTTLRVAEQRVGRVDRMDSRHDTIEAWWPDDGPAFATRANELLADRNAQSSALLGANLPVPAFLSSPNAVVDVAALADEADRVDATWDGLRDALQPIRDLVTGPDALVPSGRYPPPPDAMAGAALAVVASSEPWAFMTVAGVQHGAPRWLLVTPTIVTADLDQITDHLRTHLTTDTESLLFDDAAAAALARLIERADLAEPTLLSRRHRRALDQMRHIVTHWAAAASRDGHEHDAARWRTLARLAHPNPDDRRAGQACDLALVASAWLDMIAPVLEQHRTRQRVASFVTLDAITKDLRKGPPGEQDAVHARFARLPASAPLADRVTNCILGCPAPPPAVAAPVAHRGSR